MRRKENVREAGRHRRPRGGTLPRDSEGEGKREVVSGEKGHAAAKKSRGGPGGVTPFEMRLAEKRRSFPHGKRLPR